MVILISFETNTFDNIISKIIKSESGIKKVILTDRMGLTIASVSKFSYFPVDIDGISVITSVNFCTSEQAGKLLGLEDLNLIMCEFTGGKIFSAYAGKGVLTLISDPDIDIGLIRLILNSSGEKIREILKESFTDADFRDYRDPDKDWEDKDFVLA